MLKLVVGNKNYSSWSLRAWLLMTETHIPFEEIALSLFTPSFGAEIGKYSPAGRVPVLVDDEDGDEPLHVWDTLAIAEYLAERFEDRTLWPAERRGRARARSICAEMHSGFGALRTAMPMNVSADLAGHGWNVRVQDDVDRIAAIWRECLDRSGGPLLFGRFSIADAFFAPVVSRLATYAVSLPPGLDGYRDRVLALGGMRAWSTAARAEAQFLAEDEPYRRGA